MWNVQHSKYLQKASAQNIHTFMALGTRLSLPFIVFFNKRNRTRYSYPFHECYSHTNFLVEEGPAQSSHITIQGSFSTSNALNSSPYTPFLIFHFLHSLSLCKVTQTTSSLPPIAVPLSVSPNPTKAVTSQFNNNRSR